MGIFQQLRSELIDIVQWVDDSGHTLVWRFPRYKNEIKHGAQLIVRPGQTAVFVAEGKVADVFEPGQHTLAAKNLPILSTLQGWKYGFESPFKAEVYFVSTKQLTELKWGTPNPIMLRDPDFGAVRLSAFGTYSLRARSPKVLLEQLVGTNSNFDTHEIKELMRSLICSTFASLVGQSQIATLDLAGHYLKFSEQVRDAVTEQIDNEYGLEMPQLSIVSIGLPPEVEQALDLRSSMGIVGNMQQFQQYQMGHAMLSAAENPGGLGAAGAGAGLGVGMGMHMGAALVSGVGSGVAPNSLNSPTTNASVPGAGAGAAPVTGSATHAPTPTGAQSLQDWHLAIHGAAQGPLGYPQLLEALRAGQLTPSTLAWRQGMGDWARAETIPELAALFAPPPLPKG
jgi:membrane protease subunit (stomatin/prohibitin family)